MKTRFILILFIINLCCTYSYGYKENIHLKATTEAAKATNLSSFIVKYLGLSPNEGFGTGFFHKKLATEWVQDGGIEEDIIPRFNNHFFDPTTEQGINLPVLGKQNSSRIWGKDLSDNDWDWASAREYYYLALTSTQESERNPNLANTFRAVGQVMHLVEDLASPAHVRNDIHLPIHVPLLLLSGKDFYEEYTNDKYNNKDEFGNAFVKYNGYLPVDLSTFSSFEAFWKNNGKGLAEFTNKNFLSRDTNLDDKAYPLPFAIGEWVADEMSDPKGKLVKVRYQQGYVTDVYRPETSTYINKLSAYSYFDFEMKKRYPESPGNGVFTLNDSVHREYAQFLVPRAVGYAAGILNYFFRGTMALEIVPNGVTFRTVRVIAKNDTSTGEEMSGGEYALVIRYRAMVESGTDSNRILNDPDEYFSYRVAKLLLPSGVSRNTPVELVFDFSAEPLPANFADMTMQLVYKGKLGNEEGAVAVSPVTPVDGIYTDFHLTLPTSGVFAKASDNTLDTTFNEIRFNALTDIPGGLSVPGGRFELAIEYRLATSDPFHSLPIDTEPAGASAYIIRVSEKNGVAMLPQGVPVELVFNLSSEPLPVTATDVYLNVYYITDVTQKINAIGYLDISEPTPVDVFNNADKICINKQWEDAGGANAIALSDSDKDGIPDLFDPHAHSITNIFAKASSAATATPTSASDYTFSSPEFLAGGEFRRLGYILTDYDFRYSVLEDWVNVEPTDSWVITEGADQYPGTAVKNQANEDGTYTWPAMYSIRGKQMWWGAGVIYDNDAYSANPGCDWSSLQDVNAEQ